jgi:hypothetical protein
MFYCTWLYIPACPYCILYCNVFLEKYYQFSSSSRRVHLYFHSVIFFSLNIKMGASPVSHTN